jgi:hypothetical protein
VSPRPNKSASAARAGQKAAVPLRETPPSRPRAAPEKSSTLQKNAGEAKPRYKPANAGKGRVKGVPNAVTKGAREIFSAFIEGNAAKVQELWDRVARKNPAKALAIYAKLAEFVIPKLQRTELSGQLNHGVFAGEASTVSDPVEAMRVYQEIVMGGRDPRSVKFVSTPQAASAAPYAAPRPSVTIEQRPALERPQRPERAPEAEPADTPPEGVVTNVVVLEPLRDQHQHRPIADSKCAFCRQLWVRS